MSITYLSCVPHMHMLCPYLLLLAASVTLVRSFAFCLFTGGMYLAWTIIAAR